MVAPVSLLRELIGTNIPIYPSVTGAVHAITLHSLAGFAYALGWMVVLMLSFAGWGNIVGKLLQVPKLPASIVSIVGIAIVIFMGGCLNIFSAIYPSTIFMMVAAGVVLYCVFRRDRPKEYGWIVFWRRASNRSRILFLIAILILTIRVAGTVRLAQFDVTDDSAAYLALPQKMLDTHRFAADPFSERRITTSLGGSYFLQDMMLSATSLTHAGMADRAMGLILLAGIVFDIGIAFGLSVFQIALLEFLAYIVPQETFNLTFIVLIVPLLLGIVWIICRIVDEQESHGLRLAFLAGMIGGATISLKSTYLPIVGILSIVPFAVLVLRRKIKMAFQVSFVAWFGILAVLICWMCAMKATSGTYLFPVLGKGLDYSGRGLFNAVVKFPTTRSFVKVFLQGFALLTLAGIQFLSKPRTRLSIVSVLVLISSAVAIGALNYASSADSIWRYNFPQFFTAIVIFCASTFAAVRKFPSSKSVRAASCVGFLSMIAMVCYYDMAGRVPVPFHQIRVQLADRQPLLASLSGRRLTSHNLRTEYREVDAAIPKNGRTLENVAYSFLLDYRNHDILIMDWPGAAAPLPGWPFGRDPSAVAGYLRRNGIRYVLFDYRYALQNDAKICHVFLGSYRYSEWVREQMWLNLLTDHQLHQLKSHYRSIDDDGSMAVIDLTQLVSPSPLETNIWTVHISLSTVCSEIAARYFADPPMQSNVPKRQSSSNGGRDVHY